MSNVKIENRTDVKLGVVPTHLKFVGALAPNEDGRLPRNAEGELEAVAGVRSLIEASPVKLDRVQLTTFASAHEGDCDELIQGMQGLGLEPQIVMMVGGANPMSAADEDAACGQLLKNLDIALRNGLSEVNSTSIEAWMECDAPKDEADYQARVAQVVKLHARVFEEANLANSCVRSWNIEFLRPGEFKTFTTLGRLNEVLSQLNLKVGQTFFRGLVDAAHMGDSGLSIPENEAIMESVGTSDHLGVFHASVPTTRGCLSTDDGWVGAMLTAAAKTGKLTQAYVEVFHHEDAALEALRELDSGHGIDTRDGRSYEEVVVDSLVEVTRRLNNLKARGIL
ncbi:MAG: hypothetical protein ACQKBY_07295 [Verrucomicrobiales bacterium]